MTRSRDSRREAARARERSSSSRYLLPIVGIAVVLVAAVGAIVLTGGSNGGNASSPPPSASSSAATSSGSSGSGAPVVTGTPLPKYDGKVADPAVGQPIPLVEGSNFAGQPVAIANDGKAKVLMFIAHWCVHCQAEVPLVQAWLNGGGAPDGVELISVATGIDASLPNYPPEEWLAREGWTVPVIVDRGDPVAKAYGLSAYPFWVFVNADGTVKGRTTGELPIADLETIIASLKR